MPSRLITSCKGLVKTFLRNIAKSDKADSQSKQDSKSRPPVPVQKTPEVLVKKRLCLPWKRSRTQPVARQPNMWPKDVSNTPRVPSHLETRTLEPTDSIKTVGNVAGGVKALGQDRNQEQHQISFLPKALVRGDPQNTLSSVSDSSSEFQSPHSPRFRYRLHYGSHVENIENICDDPTEPLLHKDARDHTDALLMQELDDEVAKTTSFWIQKKRSVRPKFHSMRGPLSCPSPSPSIPSPMMVTRCKTSRGKCFPTAISPTPSTPTSPRSFFSISLRSPALSCKFSTRVAPASVHSPKDVAHTQAFKPSGPPSISKENWQRLCSINNRLGHLESSMPDMLHLHQDHDKAISWLRQKHQQTLKLKNSGVQGRQNKNAGHLRLSRSNIPNDSRDEERDDIRSPNGFSDTPLTTTFRDWSKGLELSEKEQELLTKTTVTARLNNSNNASKPMTTTSSAKSNIRPLQVRKLASTTGDAHPLLVQTKRAEKLLTHVKEKVENRLELENALWDADALLRRYETEVSQDWDLKFKDLCLNVRQLQEEVAVGQEIRGKSCVQVA
ncbi:hypothetical protein BG011_001569 [Mortierella polycephala]|uniref:Uncharacterized protein n=1 Tax=Mortierella polycephala TaxID=41804 RepID=A0A9P6Q536_9FUNG|nr:hypothetical protein BG011_001569 [Mortierella polycephala]